ncbi:MAG: hypothetical protein ACFFCW_04475 [Candidatus Hodarchaeota archaeon]
MVQEQGRYISPSVNPTYTSTRNHLFKCFQESSHPWATFFRTVYDRETELRFDQIKADPPKQWPDIAKFSIFKQWAQFFQYIGLGFLISNDHFVPESVITNNMYGDHKFVEKCLKAIWDPRRLSGSFCLHTGADFFAWTKGEDILPISDDPDLVPRIPYDVMIHTYEINKNDRGAWRTALRKGVDEWCSSIHTQLSKYPFSNLYELINNCKLLIDYFLFGRPCYTNDYLDREDLQETKKMWLSVKQFKIAEGIWNILPNLFRDVTRLYWGISYYRESLRKPTFATQLVNEKIFDFKEVHGVRKIPIRCYRSKRTLYAVLRNLSFIHRALSRMTPSKTLEYYQMQAKKLYLDVTMYLPSDPLELVELLEDVEDLVGLLQEEKQDLLNVPKIDISSNYLNSPILQMCFWIHRYHEYMGNASILALTGIKKRLEGLQERLTKEIRHFDIKNNNWDNAHYRLKEKLRTLRIGQG